jgi:hypothetical protein
MWLIKCMIQMVHWFIAIIIRRVFSSQSVAPILHAAAPTVGFHGVCLGTSLKKGAKKIPGFSGFSNI